MISSVSSASVVCSVFSINLGVCNASGSGKNLMSASSLVPLVHTVIVSNKASPLLLTLETQTPETTGTLHLADVHGI